jgi:DNA-binding transcriptional ArsR family regulator
MSPKRHSSLAAKRHEPAPVFAALGDKTRLALVARLCTGRQPYSISELTRAELTRGHNLTRQAITKHLRVLERVGIIHGIRTGRESRFEFVPGPLEAAKQYLDLVSEEWGRTLSRLKSFVED